MCAVDPYENTSAPPQRARIYTFGAHLSPLREGRHKREESDGPGSFITRASERTNENPVMKICPQKCQEDIKSNTSKPSRSLPARRSQPLVKQGGTARRLRRSSNQLRPFVTRKQVNKDARRFRPKSNIQK